MGAGHSSGQEETAGSSGNSPKTCYYDLLGVERLATEDEIKKAYRKKALELHPDRNLDDVESATRKFAEIQSAYEVLSDPQERAWYDSHRDAILSGQDDLGDDQGPATFRNVRLTSTEEIMALIRKFTPSIPFDDESTGFFGITRETFEHLALEEQAAADFDGIDCPEYPSFGLAEDEYETVVRPFYLTWAGFSTKKSFAWKDKYRLSEAPDRRVRRMMEKENKKSRDDAVRDFNDAIRFLVSFVRKRDPRYLPNAQTDAERQKSLRNAAAAQAARSRAANQEKMSSFEIPEWARARDDGPEAAQFSDLDEESEVEILECVVCNKTFKSDKQLEAHERSKKHVKAIQQLRRQMRKEGLDFELDETASPSVEEADQPPDINSSNQPAGDILEEDETQQHPEVSETGSSVASSHDNDEPSDGDDYAPRSVIQERLASDSPSQNSAAILGDIDEEISAQVETISIEDPKQKPKVGKAKAKREKKAAREEQDTVPKCSVCAEEFSSRSKLFIHIRDEGHAVGVSKPSIGGKKAKNRAR